MKTVVMFKEDDITDSDVEVVDGLDAEQKVEQISHAQHHVQKTEWRLLEQQSQVEGG